MTVIKALTAIKAAEKVLGIIVDLEPEQIQLALKAIGRAGATFGVLWGAGNPQLAGMDLDFYELKGDVLQFFQQIQKDRRYDVAFITVQMHRAKEALDRGGSS